jgi:hypothetical protein
MFEMPDETDEDFVAIHVGRGTRNASQELCSLLM